MVLDTSGSMAFVSDGLKPIKVTDPSFDKNTYLYKADVDKILDKTDTDNSKLGYSDYNYYVYDARTQTREFVPLAYWGGTAVEIENVETKKTTCRITG